MKTILAVAVALLSVVTAQREQSLNVVNSLRQVQPAYRDLQNFVIAVVSNAKINSSEVIFDFHSEVSLAKESFLRSAISQEASTLYQINGQPVTLDSSCLNLLRSSVEVNVNLAGVSFSNCINTVDQRLNAEIAQIYSDLEVNEASFVNISIYDVFRGQNIFMNPQVIIELLQAKLAQLQQSPVGLVAELDALVDSFRTRLEVVRANYRQCLTVNDQLLQTAINTVLVQLQQICLGALVPDATTLPPLTSPEPTQSTTLVPLTSPEPTTPPPVPADMNVLPTAPPAVQPDEFQWN